MLLQVKTLTLEMKRVELERDTHEELAKKQEQQIEALGQQIILVSMQAAGKTKVKAEGAPVLTTLCHGSRSRARTLTTSRRSRSVSPRSRALSIRLGSGASAVSFERTASNRLLPPTSRSSSTRSSSTRRSASPGRRILRGSSSASEPSSAFRAYDRRPEACAADLQVTRMKLVQK